VKPPPARDHSVTADGPAALPARFAAALDGALAAAPPGPLGVAVSGGGDSMSLLALAAEWAGGTGRGLRIVTVDHRLRAESAAEAAAVAARAERLGLPHTTLRWEGWEGAGNLAEAARNARRSLIAGWASAAGIPAILLGHTADDQAETVLMRLARGSGVDGLAGMAPVSEAEGLLWLRPLLGERRAALRDFLRARGWSWAEDPTNDDPGRDRAKARAMLGTLAGLGLTVGRLVTLARHMADARAVLDASEMALAGRALAWSDVGEARLALDPMRQAPRGVALHLLADLLAAVSGQPYPPRLEALDRLAARLLGGAEGGTSLHGCTIRTGAGVAIFRREPARAAGRIPAADGAVWDGRWRLSAPGPVPEGAEIGALGREGLARIDRPSGIAAEALWATPAVWLADRLLAAPAAGWPQGWRADPVIPDPRRRRLLGGR
jgi:tRNA(Ile)-lysidine synthase